MPDGTNLTELLAFGRWFVHLCVRLCLVVVAVFGLLRGIAYLPGVVGNDRPPGLVFLALPLWVYAVLWFIAGAIAVYGAITASARATFGVISMCGIWAVIYTLSWLGSIYGPQPMTRDYLTANYYWTVALLLIGGRYLAEWADRTLSAALSLVHTEGS